MRYILWMRYVFCENTNVSAMQFNKREGAETLPYDLTKKE